MNEGMNEFMKKIVNFTGKKLNQKVSSSTADLVKQFSVLCNPRKDRVKKSNSL